MLNDTVSLSRGALETFSHRMRIGALALVGPSPVDQFLFSYFTEVHKPPYPTRHFPTADEARTWLTTQPTPADTTTALSARPETVLRPIHETGPTITDGTIEGSSPTRRKHKNKIQ
jgi:hypothetical protein